MNLEFFTSAEATFHCQGLPAFSVVFASASFWAAFLLRLPWRHEIEAGGGHDGVDDGRVEQDAVDVDGLLRRVKLPSLTEAVLAETSVDLPCFT